MMSASMPSSSSCWILFFQIFKEHIIKSGEIKAVFCVSLECISFRICGVVGVEFWENTHSDLVKRSVFQCFQSLLLHLFGLVDPCVAGGSKRLESGAVLVCKMEFIFCYIEVYFLLWKYIFFRHTRPWLPAAAGVQRNSPVWPSNCGSLLCVS